MLQRKPWLTPDEVKYRLMASARAAAYDDGTLAYSLWQQGAGRVDAHGAVMGHFACSELEPCAANRGLDIGLDLDGEQHYVGSTRWDATSERFTVGGLGDDYVWNGGWAWSEGWAWGGGWAWSEVFAWSGGWAWSEIFGGSYTAGAGWAWSEALAWGGGWAWSEIFHDAMGEGSGFAWNDFYGDPEAGGVGWAWSETLLSLVTWVPDE
jgi:serine protease AprX